MEPEEEQRFCNNCKRNVAAANFSVHSAFCERNIFVCTICEEPVKISEKDQHLEEYHVMSICNLCERQVEKWLLPNHMEVVCPKRLKECKYCESNLPVDEYVQHVEFCGSRTEKCLSCRKYVMIKEKSKHDEIHMLEKQYRAKSVEEEIKQNKVNEVISKNNSTTEKISEKPPETIHSMPSRISEEEDICLSDKFKNKKCEEEHNLEIPAHERGAASLPRRDTSKHSTQCHICNQTIPWIDYNTHIPACASSAGKCSLCGERVLSFEMKEHMKNHLQGKFNLSFKVPEKESSNETTYMSNQSNRAKSKPDSSAMKCPYCSEVCSEDQILEHTRSCLKNLYDCPLCGEKVPEKDKKQHEELQCRMVQDKPEPNTSYFSRHSQNNSECPLCSKLIPEENYELHVTLQCEQLSRVGGTHGLYAAGEDLHVCVYCSEKMPQKEKTMHYNFYCKVLIESCGISLNEDSYADVTKKTTQNSYKNAELPVSCPTCKNTFSKEKILHHKRECSRIKEHCTFCNEMIDVACKDIHLKYCPGIDNRDHSHHNAVAHDSRSSNYNHKGAIPKNTNIRDMMKPRSAKCCYCKTSYNVDILPNHEKECIHMPIQCDICGQDILLKDQNTHKCKRRKGKYQNRQQLTSKESKEGSFWTKTKKILGINDEKEARTTDFTHNKHHWESQEYVPDNFERKEKLYFEQVDDPLLPCEFCQQEFPGSELVLHMTGCQPHLVSYAKPDLPEKLDSKQDSGKKDSDAFRSQSIHSAFGANNPFFAKNNSVSTHAASELNERNRKSKADELSQSCCAKKSKHHENSKKENDVEKKSLNFQSVWNVTNTLNFRDDHLEEIVDNSDKETEETTNLDKKQKEKGQDQHTSEKPMMIQSSSDNEMTTILTFVNDEKSGSEEEYLSFSDDNVEQTNSEMKTNSSMNLQNIQERQRELPLLKKMTNEEESEEVSQDTHKSSGETDRNAEQYFRQLSAGFRFGAHKTTLPFEDNGHCDIQPEKKCKDLDELSRFSERSKNQKEYLRYSGNLSDLKLGRYQSSAFSGDANINEMIDKEPDTILVKRATKFSGSLNDQKNHTNSSKLLANFNYSTNNGTDISTVLFNELEHPKILPKEHNKEPNELYTQNNSRLSDTVNKDLEYIRNYRQHLPDFKYSIETIRKHSEDNLTNVTVAENRSDYNLNRAFTLEPAGSPVESKLPLHTVLKKEVKEVGLEERIAAFQLKKETLSSAANNNVNDVKKWSGWRKKKNDFNSSDSD